MKRKWKRKWKREKGKMRDWYLNKEKIWVLCL